MKKNLKKVISAVIAMALAASMIPATLAANVALSDVADTASYATAVNTLVALGVINGYEDGTFLPDNNITRAEVSKVMVAALNKLADAEKRAGATKFTDVAAGHWASGFINVGVSNDIINGMGDGTFEPESNVTIAQVVKMLAAAMKNGQYAAFLGEGKPNWYDGWMDAAEVAGFTDNINAGAEDAATRAEVAQLVYDALLTPIVEENGYEWKDGKYVPKIATQDGVESKYYKTLLTEKFDAYYVEGYVLSKAMVEGQMEVTFGIADSEEYAESDLNATADMPVKSMADIETNSKGIQLPNVAVGNTNAADTVGVYASAIIKVDDGDYSLISFVPSGKNKTVTFDVTDIDKKTDATYISTNEEIRINGTDYKLASTVNLYVNGEKEEITLSSEAATLYNFVKCYNVGSFELVDTYKTDGKYDTIFVNTYVTGKVTSVSASSGRINFTNAIIGAQADGTTKYPSSTFTSYIELDDEDEELNYSITMNGEAISIGEIKKDDIISIAYDVDVTDADAAAIKASLAASKNFDIYVSRDTVSGKMTGRKDADKTVTVAGEAYGFVDGTTNVGSYTIGNDYTLALDAFGRIFEIKTDATSDLWGIITKLTWSAADEDYKVTLYTSEGASKVYLIDAAKAEVEGVKAGVSSATAETVNTTLYEAVATDSYSAGKHTAIGSLEAVSDRVVTYKISNVTGAITKIDFQAGSSVTDDYSKRTSQIGSAKINDNTKIMDVAKYITESYNNPSDIAASSMANLSEDVDYTIYTYGNRTDNNGAYPFILITAGAQAYTEATRFAVVLDASGIDIDPNGLYDSLYTIDALYAGEETTLLAIDEIASVVGTLNYGDVIFFQTDANGYLEQINKVFSLGAPTNYSDVTKYLYTTPDETTLMAGVTPGSNGFSSDFTKAWYTTNRDAVQVVFGPVVEADDGWFSVGMVDSSTKKTDLTKDMTDSANSAATNGILTLATSDATEVYKVDYTNEDADERVVLSSYGEILASAIDETLHTESAGNVINWYEVMEGSNKNVEAPAMAFALVADGEALAVLYYTAQ